MLEYQLTDSCRVYAWLDQEETFRWIVRTGATIWSGSGNERAPSEPTRKAIKAMFAALWAMKDAS